MTFLLALFLAGLLIGLCANPLKRHPIPFYLAAIVIALAVPRVTFHGWLQTWIWPLFSRGAFATALWAAVMWAGALPNGSKAIKRLMPIRGELSILAAILTLGHNAMYGRTYFRLFFTQPGRLPANQAAAAACSLVMLCIMLPLFVTSFRCVRKQMKGTTWKKLQRLAYGFYALLYVHVMLLTVPYALEGRGGYLLNVLVYSVAFLGYALCRVLKARALRSKQTDRLVRRQTWAMVGAAALSLCLTGGLLAAASVAPVQAEPVQAQLEGAPAAAAAPQTMDGDAPNVAVGGDSESGPDTEGQPAPEPTGAESEPPAAPSQSTDRTQAPEEQPTKTETPAPVEVPVQTAPQATTPTQTPAAPVTSEATPTPEPAPEPVRIYQNGSFSGTGDGFAGPITVSVTIQEDAITAITVTASSDDEPYWSEGKAVIGRILAAQSPNVDTVSGATFSSGGIIQAVKAALASAKT